jgi:hypothetical protein
MTHDAWLRKSITLAAVGALQSLLITVTICVIPKVNREDE